jgi:hypothetical protein
MPLRRNCFRRGGNLLKRAVAVLCYEGWQISEAGYTEFWIANSIILVVDFVSYLSMIQMK